MPKGIDVAPDGTPWFVEANAGNPGYRIGTARATVHEEWRLLPRPSLGLVRRVEALTDIVVARTGCSGTRTSSSAPSAASIPGEGVRRVLAHEHRRRRSPRGPRGRSRPAATARSGSRCRRVLRAWRQRDREDRARYAARRTDGDRVQARRGHRAAVRSPPTRGNVWFTGARGGTGGGRSAGITAPCRAATPVPARYAGDHDPVRPPAARRRLTLTPSTTGAGEGHRPARASRRLDQRQPDLRRPAGGPLQPRLPDPDPRVREGLPQHATATRRRQDADDDRQGDRHRSRAVRRRRSRSSSTARARSSCKKIKKFKATLTVTQSRNGAKPKQILKKNVKFKK